MIFLIVISIAAYLCIGFTVARLARRRLVDLCAYHKGDGYLDYWGNKQTRNHDGIYRDSVENWTWGLILGWPIASWIFAVAQGLEHDLDEADPDVQKRKIQQQKERITELERELKIK